MGRTTTGRVIVYGTPLESLNLAADVYAKHLADGNTSLLDSLDQYSWSVTGPKIENCLKKHKEAQKMARKTELLFKERQVMLDEINEVVRVSKLLLKAKYIKTPKKLGDWGFEVSDSPKAKTAKKN